MAQVVEYFENYPVYMEGPFVAVNALGNGWRIEAEYRGHKCPALPDDTVYRALEKNGFSTSKQRHFDRIEEVVDWLNSRVGISGGCHLHEKGYWYFPAYEEAT